MHYGKLPPPPEGAGLKVLLPFIWDEADRRHDERDFGRFLTRDLILAPMDTLAASDPDAVVVPR